MKTFEVAVAVNHSYADTVIVLAVDLVSAHDKALKKMQKVYFGEYVSITSVKLFTRTVVK